MNRAKWRNKRTPRPYVAFAATNEKQAKRLYRSQNLIWVWLGIASVLAAITYFTRPHLGIVFVSDSKILDIARELLFAVGGMFIMAGVWTIRRSIEIVGHVYFSTGAILNGIVALISHQPTITFGSHIVTAITVFGIAAASAFRAYFIVRWIGAEERVSDSSE